jgi:Glycosyl transferase family 2
LQQQALNKTQPATISMQPERTGQRPDFSVIVSVSERYDDVRELYYAYKEALDKSGITYEFIYVLDGDFPQALSHLRQLQHEGQSIKLIKLARSFGEATALTAAFVNSAGGTVLTLPAYYQVEPAETSKILEEIRSHDMVIGCRYPRIDSWFNRLQTRCFNSLLRLTTGCSFRDLGCGVRAFKRQVMTEVPVYGDQHRFLPLLASRQGFRVQEVEVAQSKKEKTWRVYHPGVYPRRMLDLLTVFFLVKFTKKPLRFFGLIGIATFVVGSAIVGFLIIERQVFDMPLAERPALLLASLLVVLGVQIFALGLIGELIIFTHAKDLKEYTIEEIIN